LCRKEETRALRAWGSAPRAGSAVWGGGQAEAWYWEACRV
jgi:hypothetical protein